MTAPSCPPRVRTARFAASAIFFVNGLLYATWGVNVPNFKALHGLSDAAVAFALLAAGAGALAGVLRAGRLVDRFGAGAVTVAGVGVGAAALGVLLRLPDFSAGLVALFVFGCANSIADVAINAEAAEIEARSGRPILSSCHGGFSLGGLAGAALGSGVAAAGIGPPLHLAVVGAAAAVGVALAALGLLPERSRGVPAGGQGRAAPGLTLPPRAVLLLGAMAALGFVTEGAMYDWSVLYLRDSLGAPQALAALAYAAFSVAMAAGRFGGDAARSRWGATRLLRGSGVLAAVGLVAAVSVGEPHAALLGFAVVGLAIANIVPVLFAAASQVAGVTPARGIAVVAGMGYVGFLGGPPIVGAVAGWVGLAFALGGLSVFVAALALLAGRVGGSKGP